MTRDRTGEDIPADDRRATGDHHCRQGWLTPDADQPRACPTCRPWLTAHPPRPPTAAELDAYRAQHPKPERTTQ